MKKNPGRPSFEPTEDERKIVSNLSSYGLPHEHIAIMIRDGIDAETLKKHFKKELTIGKAKANLKIGQTLFKKATDGDTAALIFWAKTQMKWSETSDVNLSVDDSRAKMSKEQRDAIVNATIGAG